MKAIHAALHGIESTEELNVTYGTFRIHRDDSQRNRRKQEEDNGSSQHRLSHPTNPGG